MKGKKRDAISVPLQVPGVVMRVIESKVAGRGTRLSVRVEVAQGDEQPLPMKVAVPLGARMPARGAVVAFPGLRMQFFTVEGRCVPLVRADGVEVITDVAPAA